VLLAHPWLTSAYFPVPGIAFSSSFFLSPLVQTFLLWNVMHGHHEGITNVAFILTAPSQIIRLIIVNPNANSGSIKNRG
jgi:hypothetical protein